MLDPDRVLALSYVPARRRAAVEALWQLDAALGDVLAGGREPLISRIKLAWWRETLEKLDTARAPSEPVLQAVADRLLPAGLTGAQLSEMEAAWAVLLSPEQLAADELETYAHARGGLLFRFTARLLDQEPQRQVERGGEAWALIDLARRSAEESDAEAAVAAARARLERHRWPSRLRPLGMLAALAARDTKRERWEPQGAPGRMGRMLRHRLTGL